MTRAESESGTDRALVSDFLESRDEGAFRRLYAAHTPRLYLFLLRLSGGREAEAEELLQETWIRASSSLPAFRWQSALATWLCGIALNAWREAARARSPVCASIESAAEEIPAGPPETRADGTGRVDLERAIRRLPEGFREVLLLHDLEGYTHEEIAGLLGISPGTSKSQLSRARGWLRRWLVAEAGSAQKEGVQ
ncbi:MAG TPA: RNA polymerase sigma factor [Thermoanaerobaculia bacterium]|nr:RNA polymerase sigma factor [Thermoanaerobaculia bacterium]